ncbi:MAG: M23 family metallopeptidase [Alphaproteobacteria bacterium]|nr:M23 family metallopeptidase [Alphaproteobacteria bacterium]
MWRKNAFLLILGLCILMPLVAYCESLLGANSFPKTFEDLSFASQMELKEEGYAPFADLSAYDILTILDTDEGIAEEIATNEAETSTTNTNQQTTTTNTTVATTPSTPAPTTVTPTAVQSNAQEGYCAIKNNEIPAHQQLPIGKPVFEAHYKYCSKYGYRNMYNKQDFHYGFDIGCTEANFNNPVFAIADGVVEKVHNCSKGSSAGNYILINHKNGFKTYYMHLEKIFVTQGQEVSAGCQIAALGFTGGPKINKAAFADQLCPKMRKSISHLHYEIHYTGNQTSINGNGRTIQIKHGKSSHNSVDPSYFMGVPQHM